MNIFLPIAILAALAVPASALAAKVVEFVDCEGAAAPECPATITGAQRSVWPPSGSNPHFAPQPALSDLPRDWAIVDAAAIGRLEAAARQGELAATVALSEKYQKGEGVPGDRLKAHLLLCRAAKYGHAEALFRLGLAFAEGSSVARNERVAATLLRLAAARGHPQAPDRLIGLLENLPANLPSCLVPAPLPVATLPPVPPGADGQDPQMPPVPKDIGRLVQKLAPQYAIDSNLALAVMWAESAFDPNALSAARAQGLMQLIPETAERFGVRNVFDTDENIKGGLAYLR